MSETTETTPKADVTVSRHGSLFLFTLDSEAARKWVKENVPLESWQWLGADSFAVEYRFATGLASVMQDADLVVV